MEERIPFIEECSLGSGTCEAYLQRPLTQVSNRRGGCNDQSAFIGGYLSFQSTIRQNRLLFLGIVWLDDPEFQNADVIYLYGDYLSVGT
jgi:hypothetical protein